MRPRIVDFLDLALHVRFFDLVIPNPATMYAVAMVVGLLLFARRCQQAGLSRYHALGAGLWAMAGGLAGTRVFFLVQHLDETIAYPRQILSFGGGITSWGAFLGGALGFFLYFRFRAQVSLAYGDCVASCLGLGIALGRLSCFLNGDDFGTLSGLPWAVRFPHASYPFVAQVRAGILDPIEDLSLPVHPVQLYLSLNGVLLFVLASWYWKKLRNHPGATFWLFWLTYSPTRFVLEFLRGDQSQRIAGLTVPQVMCAVILVPAALGLWWSLGHGLPGFVEAGTAADSAAQEASHQP